MKRVMKFVGQIRNELFIDSFSLNMEFDEKELLQELKELLIAELEVDSITFIVDTENITEPGNPSISFGN